MVELEGLEQATSAEKKEAITAINNFANDDTTPTAWKNVDKKDFVSTLMDMVQHPDLIHQQNTDLCGIAVSSKAAIEYDPVGFVNMALGLYQYGKYGKEKVNKDLLSEPVSKSLNAATFVVMTALRDISNNVLPYNPRTSSWVSGFGWPNDVNNILTEKVDLERTRGKNWPDGISTPDLFVNGIQKAISAQDIVILVVNVDYFDGTSNWNLGSNHYIQVTGVSNNPDGTINVSWWSWGDSQGPTKMTKKDFLNATYFYESFR